MGKTSEIYQNKQETWSKEQCKKAANRTARDGMGTPYPFKGFIGDSQYGEKLYNGGCIRDDQWYAGEFFPLPIVAEGYKIIRVPTWGYRIVISD